MAIFGMVLALIAMLAGGAYWIDDNAHDRGVSECTSETLESDKAELIALNLENADLVNQLNLQTAEHRATTSEIRDEHKIKLKENASKRDLAYKQYGNTIRVLLAEAEGNRKDKASRERESATAYINGLPGTEGANLSPEGRRDNELLWLDADAEAILLELCIAEAKNDRKPTGN